MYHELLLSTIVQHKSFINVFAKEFSFNLPHKLLLSTIEQHKQNFKAKAKQSKARHYPTQKYCTMVTVYLVQLLLMISTLITAATATDDKNKNADLFDLTKYIKGEEGPVAEQYDRLRPNDNIFERNNNGNVGTRIVGGEESDIDEFPYFVSINGRCGGALITPDTVLFTASCGNATDNSIIVGAYRYQNNAGNASERFCDEWIQSPFFGEGGRLSNDVALCKLHAPVYINKSATKLVLNNNLNIPSVDDNGIGDDLIVMGFGLEKEHEEGGVIQQTLRDVIVPYVTNEVCSASYGNIFPEMLCAGFVDGKFDACHGDTGGPIVKKIIDISTDSITHVHVGIVSFGNGCARPNFPGVYARTSSGYDWIVDQVCNKWKSIDPDFCPDNIPVQSSCSSIGKHNLTILLQTDQYGRETSWELTKESTNEVILSEDRYENSYFNHMESTCVEEGESYTFEIKDDYGDGLCAPDLDCGFYTIKLDDEVIKLSDGMFGASDTFLFSVAAPSASPTETPTTAPSASPTETPTTAPSASPTETPTTVPSASPASDTSASPIESISESPTMARREFPTVVATPSESPSESSTVVVTSASPIESLSESPTAVETSGCGLESKRLRYAIKQSKKAKNKGCRGRTG